MMKTAKKYENRVKLSSTFFFQQRVANQYKNKNLVLKCTNIYV